LNTSPGIPIEYPEVNGTNVTMKIENFNHLNEAILTTLPAFVGFCFYTIIFGISLIASILCLVYLLKLWKKTSSHLTVITFTILVSFMNIALFGIRAASVAADIRSLNCPSGGFVSLALTPIDNLRASYLGTGGYRGLSLTAVPIFLWISDAFLLYRAWVIWIRRRKYVTIPALAFLASVVSGIYWLVQDITQTGPLPSLLEFAILKSLERWTPALGFSCGLDALTTGMIAGRLIYHHRKHKKLTESRSTFYMLVMMVFIESAALSLIAKIVQLTIPHPAVADNPIVVPLCTISSNLIVLRKALGADAGRMLAGKAPQDLSTLRFRSRGRRGEPQASETGDGSIPGVFGAHLIRTIGGHTVDIGPLDDYNSERPSTEIQNGHKA